MVKDGDLIELDVANRRIELMISEEELMRRRRNWTPPEPVAVRGYASEYIKHVQQADKGADMDFLVGCSGSKVTRDSH
jgi:L-arabonate dehydrase